MMKSITRRTEDTAIHIVNAIVGICLMLSPWVLGYAGLASAAWCAWLTGGAMTLVSLGALVTLAEWEEWVNMLLGAWAVVAPWILGFSATATSVYTHVVAGLIIVSLAAIELWSMRKGPLSTA